MIPFCAILLPIGVVEAIVTMPLVRRPTTRQDFRKVSATRASRAASGDGYKEAQSSPFVGDKVDSEYYVEIGIGTPPQKFMLLVETGSPYLWVPSVRCEDRSSSLGAGHYYDNSLSSTWHSCPELGRFTSPSGFYNGTYAKDTVIMGGFAIEKQTFGEATQRMAGPFLNMPFDGVLGLSLIGAAGGIKNPIYNLAAQGKIKHTILGIFLDSGAGNASVLSLGGSQKSLYTEDLFYTPLSIWYFLFSQWLVQGDDVKVGDRSTNYCGWTGCHVTFTTGDFGVFFSTHRAGGRGDMVMNMMGWVTRNCSNANSMPIVTLTLNGKDFPLGAEFYIMRFIDHDTGMILCQQYVFSIDEGQTDDFLKSVDVGAVFLRKYYSIWDFDRARLGFALAKVPVFHPIDDSPNPEVDEFDPHKSLQLDTEVLFM